MARDREVVRLSILRGRFLKPIILRALNTNQILILSELRKNYNRGISAVVRDLSEEHGIAQSTLKLNARILKDLSLADFGDRIERKPAVLTEFGRGVIEVIFGEISG